MKQNWLLAIGLTLVLAMVGLCGCSQGSPIELPEGFQVNLNTQQEGIWVGGKGEMTVTPDIATLSLGVESQKATVAEAQAEASEAMEEVKATLKDSGVDEKDIQTQYFRIRQRTEWDRETEEEIVVGYQVTNRVSAKIRDIDKVGTIIDTAAKAGGDLVRIQGISFSVEDPSAYYEELREKAMADAEAKAEQLAELAGVTLGKPTYVSEGIQVPPSSWVEYMVGGMAPAPAPAPAPPPTPISPGETKISLTLQVAYAILA